MHYVGRFATTRAKLATYLRRKLHERGWESTRDPDVSALIERWQTSATSTTRHALSKGRTLAPRYGGRRVDQALRQRISARRGAGEGHCCRDAVDSAIPCAGRRI